MLLVAFAAYSQDRSTVQVRSGEHKSFSRLVFDLGIKTAANITKIEGRYILSFEGPSREFDLSNIYNLIPKSRLKSIVADVAFPDALVLMIAEDHHLELSNISNGRLIVDVVEGAPTEDAIETRSDETEGNTGYSAVNTEQIILLEPQRPMQFVPEPPAQHSDPSPFRGAGKGKALDGLWARETLQLKPNATFLPEIRVAEAQQRLVKQLARAMTQGIVNLPVLGQDPFDGATSKEVPPANLPRADPLVDPVSDAQEKAYLESRRSGEAIILNHINLEAQTVYDGAGQKSGRTKLEAKDTLNCLGDSDFNLADWKGANPTREEISKLRRDLSGEFDLPKVPTLERLVKLYIVSGFGTEALALLSSFDGYLQSQSFLAEMAEIMENGSVSLGTIVADQAQCSGASAMWAILARPAIPLGEEPERDSINRNFADLPASIRQRVGPWLGARLLKAGFIENAEDIAMLLQRASGPDTADFLLFRAKLDFATDRNDSGRIILENLIETNQPNTPMALLVLFEHLIEQGVAIPNTLLTEVSARAFELRYNEWGKTLKELEIRAKAYAQEQKEAFEILAIESDLKLFNAQETSRIASGIFRSFDPGSSKAGEISELYFTHRQLLTPSLSLDLARKDIAEALLKAGLPADAFEVLVPLEDRMSKPLEILFAQIYLALDQPQKVLEALDGNETVSSANLRLLAMEKLGQFDQIIKSSN